MSINGMDLDALEQEAASEDKGVVVHLRDLDGNPWFFRESQEAEPEPVTVTVCGINSATYRAVERRLRRRPLERRRMTGEAVYSDEVEKAAACTKEWTAFVKKNGDGTYHRIRCDPENAARIYAKAPHVLRQVQEAMEDRSLFSQNSLNGHASM